MENRRVFRSNFFVLVIMVLYLIGGYTLPAIWENMNMPLYLYLFLPEFLFIFIPIVIYFIITRKPIIETLRLKKLNFSSLLIVIGIGFLIQPIASLFSIISQFVFPNDVSQLMAVMVDIPLSVKILVIAVTPALFEEMSMRGIVLKGYDNVNIHKGAIITGLFFGMMHMNGQQFLYAFVLGIIFAYLVRITGSIFSSMIVHFIVNASNTIIAHYVMKFLDIFGGIEQLTSESSITTQPIAAQIVAVTFYFFLSLVCGGVIFLLIRKLAEVNNSNIFIESKEVADVSQSSNDLLKEDKIKVLNWPFIGCIIIFLVAIIRDLIFIYG
ncbi:lysostaphin resistance A-like protein [Clostridium sp. DL1XJH146]